MSYQVDFTKGALRELKKLDQHTRMLLLGWVRKNLQGCTDPRRFGKPLTANRTGQWRYRVGDYRLIAEIRDAQVLILIVQVGHRRDSYD